MRSPLRLRRIVGFVLVTAASCSSPADAPQDASPPDASAEVNDAAVGRDSGTSRDSGAPRDAGREDAGHDAGNLDAAPRDAGPIPDAALDAMAPLDASPADATITDSSAGDAAVAIDAGPPARPVGTAVDVTGSRCALDSAGNMWCWGRWTPVESPRLLGAGLDSAQGSCALRGREVWCAEFTTLTMLAIVDGSSVLEVDSVAEYSDLHRGCGLRTAPGGWSEAVCWTDGGSVVREGGTGSELVAVTAVEPRMVSAISGPYEAYDINPPGPCRSSGVVDCTGVDPARPPGDHFVLGFAMACAHNAGSSTCSTNFRSPSWTVSNPGFREHAVAWPVGSVDPTRPYDARGLCVGGDFGVRCYDDAGTLAYTVAW